MKSKALILALSSALLSTPSVASSSTVSEADLQQARSLAQEFGDKLKPELQKAMKSGGPVAAVAVCKEKAPAIAKAMSEQSGWHIKRVSLKPRGAAATADAWETKILNSFELQKDSGTKIKHIEHAEVVADASGKSLRYMRAVGTGEICLTCHGVSIAAPVQKALNEHYPNDKATGFSKGDIRGAFSFSKEIK